MRQYQCTLVQVKLLREYSEAHPELFMHEILENLNLKITRFLAYRILANNCYRDENYKPKPKRRGRPSIERKIIQRPTADSRDYQCPVCGMGDPVIGKAPFKSQAEADKCCARLALCQDNYDDADRWIDSVGRVIRKARKPSSGPAIAERRTSLRLGSIPVRVEVYSH